MTSKTTASQVTPMKRFKSNYNYESYAKNGEHNIEPSMAIPNRAMSISEILSRHVQGLPIPKKKQMFFGGNTEYPAMHMMNEMDQIDTLRYQQELVKQKDAEMQTQRKKRKAAIAADKAAQQAAKTTQLSQTSSDKDDKALKP